MIRREVRDRGKWIVRDGPKVKTILGYDIVAGTSVEDYERWLWDIHYPDLLANPHLDKIELNTMIRPVNTTSAGTPIMEIPETFYAIAELHYANMAAYESYLQWFVEHPIPVERSPAGRSEFKFYVLCEVAEAAPDRASDL